MKLKNQGFLFVVVVVVVVVFCLEDQLINLNRLL